MTGKVGMCCTDDGGAETQEDEEPTHARDNSEMVDIIKKKSILKGNNEVNISI